MTQEAGEQWEDLVQRFGFPSNDAAIAFVKLSQAMLAIPNADELIEAAAAEICEVATSYPNGIMLQACASVMVRLLQLAEEPEWALNVFDAVMTVARGALAGERVAH